MQDRIKWQAREYEHYERPKDWYWALAIIALSFAITSVMLGNILFAALIIVAAFAGALHSSKEPEIFEFEINQKGVRIGDKIYLYNSLESFWVEEDFIPQLILRSQKMIMPYIVIPLGEENPEIIKEYLLNFLEEEEMHEPLFNKLMEYLGF